MSSTLPSPPTIVTGHANDPHLAAADGSRRGLRFFSDFAPGARVLDVGCGNGQHLRELVQGGQQAVGVEVDGQAVSALQAEGYDVVQAAAEQLPFPDGSFDAIVCSVVLPYTDERRAVAEWGRVLTPGGQIRASGHGLAYALGHLLRGPGWRVRVYGGRTMVNSWVYSATGRRLPGFWGDTLYQSAGRLNRYYRAASLDLITEYVRPGVGGLRDVFFHHLQKVL